MNTLQSVYQALMSIPDPVQDMCGFLFALPAVLVAGCAILGVISYRERDFFTAGAAGVVCAFGLCLIAVCMGIGTDQRSADMMKYAKTLTAALNDPSAHLGDVQEINGVLSANLYFKGSSSEVKKQILGQEVTCTVVGEKPEVFPLSEELIKALSERNVHIGTKPIAVAFADSMSNNQHAMRAVSRLQ